MVKNNTIKPLDLCTARFQSKYTEQSVAPREFDNFKKRVTDITFANVTELSGDFKSPCWSLRLRVSGRFHKSRLE